MQHACFWNSGDINISRVTEQRSVNAKNIGGTKV